MVTEAPCVQVILLNWNGWRDTLACLESLTACRYQGFRAVVVDNGSADDSAQRISSWCRERAISLIEQPVGALVEANAPAAEGRGLKEVALLRSANNLGFCAGNNAGAAYAFRSGAHFALFLNNDTVCDPDFLGCLVACAQAEPDAGLVGGLVYRADRPEMLWYAGQRLESFFRISRRVVAPNAGGEAALRGVPVDWVTGCLMLLPRRVYQEVGCFHEAFFMWHDDLDISLRVRNAGYRLLLVPAARIYHKVSSSIGALSPRAYYYAHRNLLLLSARHSTPAAHALLVIGTLARWCASLPGFLARGRWRCAVAGIWGLLDYFLGRNGRWIAHAGAGEGAP